MEVAQRVGGDPHMYVHIGDGSSQRAGRLDASAYGRTSQPSPAQAVVARPVHMAGTSGPAGPTMVPHQPFMGVAPQPGYWPTEQQPVYMAQPNLTELILHQVHYYFSDANLMHDEFLRGQMDPREGWLPLQLLATFNRLRSLTTEVAIIADALRFSTELEVHGSQVRRRHDWLRWLQQPSPHGLQSGSSVAATSPDSQASSPKTWPQPGPGAATASVSEKRATAAASPVAVTTSPLAVSSSSPASPTGASNASAPPSVLRGSSAKGVAPPLPAALIQAAPAEAAASQPAPWRDVATKWPAEAAKGASAAPPAQSRRRGGAGSSPRDASTATTSSSLPKLASSQKASQKVAAHQQPPSAPSQASLHAAQPSPASSGAASAAAVTSTSALASSSATGAAASSSSSSSRAAVWRPAIAEQSDSATRPGAGESSKSQGKRAAPRPAPIETPPVQQLASASPRADDPWAETWEEWDESWQGALGASSSSVDSGWETQSGRRGARKGGEKSSATGRDEVSLTHLTHLKSPLSDRTKVRVARGRLARASAALYARWAGARVPCISHAYACAYARGTVSGARQVARHGFAPEIFEFAPSFCFPPLCSQGEVRVGDECHSDETTLLNDEDWSSAGSDETHSQTAADGTGLSKQTVPKERQASSSGLLPSPSSPSVARKRVSPKAAAAKPQAGKSSDAKAGRPRGIKELNDAAFFEPKGWGAASFLASIDVELLSSLAGRGGEAVKVRLFAVTDGIARRTPRTRALVQAHGAQHSVQFGMVLVAMVLLSLLQKLTESLVLHAPAALAHLHLLHWLEIPLVLLLGLRCPELGTKLWSLIVPQPQPQQQNRSL